MMAAVVVSIRHYFLARYLPTHTLNSLNSSFPPIARFLTYAKQETLAYRPRQPLVNMSGTATSTISTKEIISTQLPSQLQSETPQTRRSFLSLPVETREMIYKELFAFRVKHGITSFHPGQMYWRRVARTNMSLLRTCKIIHLEASRIFYKKVVISGHYEDWIEFLCTRIGRNAKFVQELEIHCRCQFYYRIPGFVKSNYHLEEEWEYFWKLLEALPKTLNLRHFKLKAMPCRDTDVVRQNIRYCHRQCHIYPRIEFPKYLAEFKDVETLELSGQFNPIWAYALHARLGFLVKRDYPYLLMYGTGPETCTWTFVNTNYSEKTTDQSLWGYKQSSIEGIYDKVNE